MARKYLYVIIRNGPGQLYIDLVIRAVVPAAIYAIFCCRRLFVFMAAQQQRARCRAGIARTHRVFDRCVARAAGGWASARREMNDTT